LFLGNTGTPLVLGPYVPYWSKSFEFPDYQPSTIEAATDSVKDFVLTKILHHQQKLAHALLVSTPAALVKMSGRAGVHAKTHELPYCVDVESFSPATEKPDDSSPSILFLANLRYQKGIYTLLDAFEIVARIHPTCRLTIGGGGEEEAEIKRRIARMNLESRITLTGNVERRNVPDLIRECTVYCLPSYGEPFGMSALEAMACGKPIVATDVGGLSYLITDESGRKVPPKDAPALAAALLEIVNSTDLQTQMSEFNRAKALQNYTATKIVERLEEIYRQVIDSK
jgi:glycosyltransferase involved in cell wall biosynthesis